MSEHGINLSIEETKVLCEFLSNQWLTRDGKFQTLRDIINKMQRAIEAHEREQLG